VANVKYELADSTAAVLVDGSKLKSSAANLEYVDV